jgi:hypothetical protein
MVWDRHAREPARLEGGRPVIDLTEEQAREISDELNKNPSEPSLMSITYLASACAFPSV